MLNKQKGNMYPFVSHTWNPIKGKCPHDCNYCYMKNKPVGKLRLDEKCLKDNLGENNFIFVGSSVDMFAVDVPKEWIIKVLNKCKNFEGNTYLFQTKNPHRFWLFGSNYPRNTIFGTTLETNRDSRITSSSYKSEPPKSRASNMGEYFMKRKMISIEPIMNFDLEPFVDMIKQVNPEFVSIGADSKNHNLPEPSKEKVEKLIEELKKFTEVKIKDNLKRLTKEGVK